MGGSRQRGAYKEFFGPHLAELLAEKISDPYPTFARDDFVAEVAAAVAPLELKARVAVIADGLRRHLPSEYPEALGILVGVLGEENEEEVGMFTKGYWLMPVAYFVEVYGLEHFEISMAAIYEITKRHTSEFAVRPFIARYPEESFILLRRWVGDPNPHVRRLVSEGTRPRLPWARRLDVVVEDPEPVLALLDVLKDDRSAYVRKSVANNLNDLSKYHPRRVLQVLRSWSEPGSEHTRWISRHALRTLTKKGDPEAIDLVERIGG